MALLDILKQLDLRGLNTEQRTVLTTRLQKYRRELQRALGAVDRGLEQLTPGPAPEPTPAAPAARARRRKPGT